MDELQIRELFQSRWLQLVRCTALLNSEEPEEIASEAFARLYERRATIRSPEAAFRYLTLTAANLTRDRSRRSYVAAKYKFVVNPAVPHTDTAHEDPAMTEAIRRLPARQREVIVLRFWLDLLERDIALSLGISPGSVKTHLSRALKALRSAKELSTDDR